MSSPLHGTSHGVARDQTIRKSSSLGDTQLDVALSRIESAHTVCADELHGPVCPRATNHGCHLKGPSQGVQDCAVHRMPPEILGIIFENCLPENGAVRPVLSEPPLLLGRICSYWRSLSQSTPKLWTSLTFKFLETHIDRSRDGTKVSSAFHTWLRRSSLPMSISLTDNRIFQKDTEEVIVWLLLQIRAHAPRWRDIHLQFSSDYFIQLSALSPCKFTALESFSVHTDHMGWRRGLIAINLDLTHARQLTSLSYTGPDRVVREDLLVDWSRLTAISFQYDLHEASGESSTLPRHFFALALCENLTQLAIGLGTTAARHLPNPATTRLHLPRLHTLRIRRLSRSAHAAPLIDALVLPHLLSLTLDSARLVGWDGWHTHGHETQCSGLLHRSGCPLVELVIREVDVPMGELGRCLKAAKGLRRLTFVPCPRAQPIGELLERLSVGRVGERDGNGNGNGNEDGEGEGVGRGGEMGETGSFPELERIHIGCAHEAYLAPLAEMVEGRCGETAIRAGVTPLTAFELVFFDFVHDGHPLRRAYFDMFKKRLLRCAEDGKMDVVVRVERPYEPAYISLPYEPEYVDVASEQSRAC